MVTSVRASPLEGKPLKDDAEDYSIDYAADYDMSGDEEEWPEEFLERGEPSEFYLQEVREQLENRTAPQAQPLTRSRRHTFPGMKRCSSNEITFTTAGCKTLHWFHMDGLIQANCVLVVLYTHACSTIYFV